ncbi:MAG: HDIG domain-containing protein [Nitrospirae bacterium]|nr:HDIG domain-containing protein [Nitrospirota bacterium]
MKGTKNGIIKNNIKRRPSLSKPQTFLSLGRQDISRVPILLLTAFISALAIQSRISIEQLFGGFLITSVLLFILYKDIMRYKPAYINNYNMLILLCFLLVFNLLIGRLFNYLLYSLSKGTGFVSLEGAIFGMPLPAGAMLVTLLFDFHTAITFSFTMSLLTGLWLQDASYIIYAFVGSLTAAFSVIRCKKRSALIWGGLYIVLVNITTLIIILLFEGDLFTTKTLSSMSFAMIAGVSVSAIVSLLLPLLEYTFKITTDISLLELLDLNQPIIRNLMITVPGTYHHSVIVGSLAESAAEAVGVNPLLARVSSYYHDIGKVKMPEYFIENQVVTESKHDSLTPHMSSMIIVNHIKEGVEIAKENKIPQPIIDIIQQHHGTSLMSYFYQKAKEQKTDILPSESDYRYPGPKPQTRVAALIMMADAVEAASRVLTDPTPARISSLVDRIINHIFLDGQLDECELTLKDIHEIKRCFTYILTGIFHKRIDYPGFDFTDEGIYREQTKVDKVKSAEKNKSHKEGTQVPRSQRS